MVDLDETSRAIVELVGLYRVGIRSAFSALVGSNCEPDGRLATLVKHGFLQVHRGLPGNRSVYQLTQRGAAVIGVSSARARRLGSQSLLKNLGVLLFCHTPATERHRVEVEHLASVFSGALPEGAYCIGLVKDRVVVFDCYVPGPQTPVATVVRRLDQRLRKLKKLPDLERAIQDKRLGLAVVVHTRPRRKAIMDAVRTATGGPGGPLISRIRIWVEFVESFANALGMSTSRRQRATDDSNPTLEFPDFDPGGSQDLQLVTEVGQSS